ncbi:hypothetical protein S7711_10073 [Stachybotrys chartarum IBT 7711]|uniref:Protein kinase domain-containing protein n=1 Tax=Stachybotrys chartarum (strain CBS 109288 / IBT 7711) TaxID=1280523 RepID=A0A084AJQ7_STACB|nr:hypothetical protein S7711_10073 [Stachybotrys chartarum IBT 7711]
MPATDILDSYLDFWVSAASGTGVLGTEAEPDKFNFLTFLAIAQTFQIEFLPLAWDTARGVIGTGGSSKIHQALIDINTGFAFKTYHKRKISEEQVFRSLIAEITLQGICWDVSADDEKPWPVLVFEKSHLGDLYEFARNGGRDVTVEQRLGLCLDIGQAIMDMHSNQIVHGDIKPENILIFRDRSGRYSARVIDFGYSTRYVHDKQRITLPRSEPWNAPENDGRTRGWTPLQAVKSDLFCLGMLYLWLLFEPCLRGTAPALQSRTEDSLRRMKGELPIYAQKLLASEISLDDDMRKILERFFNSSLMQDPEQRDAGSLQNFLRQVDPQRIKSQGMELDNLEYNIESSHFKV